MTSSGVSVHFEVEPLSVSQLRIIKMQSKADKVESHNGFWGWEIRIRQCELKRKSLEFVPLTESSAALAIAPAASTQPLLPHSPSSHCLERTATSPHLSSTLLLSTIATREIMATTNAYPPGGTFLDTLKKSFTDVPVDTEKDNAISTTEFLEAAESLTTLFGTAFPCSS